jgi:hypothetical protein
MTIVTQESRFQAEDVRLEEVYKITRTLIRIANSTDAKDWTTFRAQFADQVLVDFGEVKPAQTMLADDLVNWSAVAYGRMETQHMVSNHDVLIEPGIDVATAGNAEDTARVTSYGHALHRQKVSAGEDYWHIYCRYDHELARTEEGWKVTRLKMTPFEQQGNANLLERAYRDATVPGSSSAE